ncbi:MAG: sigma-70 family RNA polymerase sigma factor [Planctomycetes bacterium]|nr:sigma-70 family RNA polymerase sigma factor [Planctomycetota bacterium]
MAQEEVPKELPGEGFAGRDEERVWAGLAETAPAVRRYLFGLCGDWHQSEDLSHEALLKAWQNRHSFDGRASLKTWVFTIARNEWLTGLRQKARRPQEEALNESLHIGTDATPDAAAFRGELADAVAKALDRLPGEQREVLALRESGGLTFEQMAGVLGLPVGTIKSRVRYALLKLAEELEPFRKELDS